MMGVGNKTIAVVALGCGVNLDGSMTPQTEKNVIEAISIFKQERGRSKNPFLVLSGGNGIFHRTEAGAMEEYALENGVPGNAILLETLPRNTRQNAEQCLALAREHRISEVLIVSCYPHTKLVHVCFWKQEPKGVELLFRDLPEQEYSPNAVQIRLRSRMLFRLWTFFSFIYYSLF